MYQWISGNMGGLNEPREKLESTPFHSSVTFDIRINPRHFECQLKLICTL